MKIAVEGCAHGELEKIYETIAFLETKNNTKVDLLLCCGDFQASRNNADLECMAVPHKFRKMGSFYKYYSGELIAPILTIVIGGNHEASNYFSELAYGGWIAPNIYYLGYAGVVTVGGVRIAGLSGIFKPKDYQKGRFEKVPYSEDTKRSCYHVRALDVFRLKQLSKPLHIMLSHDWPEGVTNHGDIGSLLRKKPFFKAEVESSSLGSQVAAELLSSLQPEHWFAAHLHVKFPALVPHDNGNATKFLALDKCLPRRQFLQIVDIAHTGDIALSYDLEWLTILQLTDHLTSVRHSSSYMPGPNCGKRWIFNPTYGEKEAMKIRLNDNLTIPLNFTISAPPHDSSHPKLRPWWKPNPQTTAFCTLLGVDDPLVLLMQQNPGTMDTSFYYRNKLNYSSFQDSDDGDPADDTPSSPYNVPTASPRTPMKLPAPRTADIPPLSRTPIQLPPPVVESTPVPDPSEDQKIHQPCTPIRALAPEDVPESSAPISVEPPVTPAEAPAVESIGDDGVESPGPKRFRRRNQASYAPSTEDE